MPKIEISPTSSSKHYKNLLKNIPRRIFKDRRDAGEGAFFATPPISKKFKEVTLLHSNFEIFYFNFQSEFHLLFFLPFCKCS